MTTALTSGAVLSTVIWTAGEGNTLPALSATRTRRKIGPSGARLGPATVFQVNERLFAGLEGGRLPQPFAPFTERCQRTARMFASAAFVVSATAAPLTEVPAAGVTTEPVGSVLSTTTWIV